MNTLSNPLEKKNRFLNAIGATSWGDAVICFVVYAFLAWLFVSFAIVTGTFLGAFFLDLP